MGILKVMWVQIVILGMLEVKAFFNHVSDGTALLWAGYKGLFCFKLH